MNYYELKNFKPLIDRYLPVLFGDGKTIKRGAISVWGDTIGRPGDTIYKLKNIDKKENEIVFDFGSSEIVVINPKNTYVNEKVIGFDSCDKIIWKELEYDLILEYDYINEKLITNTVKGEHSFRVNLKEYAFMLYTW